MASGYPTGPDGQPVINNPPLPWQLEQLKALPYFYTDQTSGTRAYYVDAEHPFVDCGNPGDTDWANWCHLQTANEYNAEPDHSQLIKTQQAYACLVGRNSTALCQQLASDQLLLDPVLYQQGLTLGQQQAQGFVNGQKPLPLGQLPQALAAMVRQLGGVHPATMPAAAAPAPSTTAAFDESGTPMPQPAETTSVGGDISTNDTPDTNPNSCISNTCKCLTASNDGIKDALNNIADKLGQQIKPSCDSVLGCMDSIVQELYKRLYKPAKTCEQCKQDISAGLAGTLEFALSCAGACINDCQCSVSSPTADSSPTCDPSSPNYDPNLCGEQPAPDQPQTPDQYIGWCNHDTGETAVTKDGDSSFGPPWQNVGVSPTESGALSLAANCQAGNISQEPPPLNTQPIAAIGQFCTVTKYTDGSYMGQMQSGASELFSKAAEATIWKNIRDVGWEGLNVGKTSDAVRAFINVWTGAVPMYAEKIVPFIAGSFGCDDPGFTYCIEAIAAYGILEKLSGCDLHEFATPYQYQVHAKCRQKQLSPDGATAAFLANAIDLNGLDSHYAIAGFCAEAVQSHLAASQSKPVPEQLIKLRRRGLNSQSDYNRGMRRLGYLEPNVVEQLFTITNAIPPANLVVEFAAIGVENSGTVSAQNLDKGFTSFYSGQYKQWLDAEGITEQHAKDLWRSHWAIPGIGTLEQFYRRLRRNTSFGGEQKLRTEITAALDQLSISPQWQQHYIATMTTPLLRRDGMRAYQYGVIDKNTLSDALAYSGYNDDAIQQVSDLALHLRRRQVESHPAIKQWTLGQIPGEACAQQITMDGYTSDEAHKAMEAKEYEWLSSPIVEAYSKGQLDRDELLNELASNGVSSNSANAMADRLAYRIVDHVALRSYATGTITKDEARQEMVAAGMVDTIADKLLSDADDQIRNAFSAACQNGIKQQFLHGEIDQNQAATMLAQYGVVTDRINMLQRNWSCEKSSVGRPVMAAELCGWLKAGLITGTDFYNRLIKLGYTDANANLILTNCQIAYNRKLTADAVKQVKAQQAADRKAMQQMQRDEAARERQIKAAKQASVKAAVLREARDKKMLTAAEYVYKRTSSDLPNAINAVKDAIAMLVRDYGIQPSEAVDAVLLASSKFPSGSLTDWLAAVTAIAEGLVNSPFVNVPSDSDLLENMAGLIQPS